MKNKDILRLIEKLLRYPKPPKNIVTKQDVKKFQKSLKDAGY